MFTSDWFSGIVPVWEVVLAAVKGKPGLRYLKIGVWEGRSLLWMLENVLTHPTSRLTGIDIVEPENLTANLKKSGQAHRIQMIIGPSQIELRKLAPRSYDLIYVDGSHTADDVLADAVLAWTLLKPGGLIIFDDYGWDGSFYTGRGPMPAELTPRLAIHAFFSAYLNEIVVVHAGYQMMFEKRENPCGLEVKGYCSPFVDYLYLWRKPGRLCRAADLRKTVDTSPEERSLIEAYLIHKRLDPALLADPRFVALDRRLGLGLVPRDGEAK